MWRSFICSARSLESMTSQFSKATAIFKVSGDPESQHPLKYQWGMLCMPYKQVPTVSVCTKLSAFHVTITVFFSILRTSQTVSMSYKLPRNHKRIIKCCLETYEIQKKLENHHFGSISMFFSNKCAVVFFSGRKINSSLLWHF